MYCAYSSQQIQQTLLTSQNDKHNECHLCIFWCTCIIEANYHKNTPTMPYKAVLPVLHARKRSFMKMASKIKTTNFTSWEIEVLPSEIHGWKRRRDLIRKWLRWRRQEEVEVEGCIIEMDALIAQIKVMTVYVSIVLLATLLESTLLRGILKIFINICFKAMTKKLYRSKS